MPSSSTAASDWEKYGIPPRQPSTTLWAHLLGKDKLPAPPNSEIIPPPIAPSDKNGSSMRILLHDTQAHLERFSVRADKLCSSVQETQREITLVNTLFQREHETLRDDLVDLVNRSQMELQKALGSPAQAPTLERLTKDVDRRLEALDKRIDAIQALNHSQGQTFQIQSQALQTIQDQQGTIVAALMPLLPLLQAIPLHIESARKSLDDSIAKSSRTPVHTPSYLHPSRAADSTHPRRRKRSSSTLGSDRPSPSPPHANKRPRISAAPQRSNQSFKFPEEAPSGVKRTLSQHSAASKPQCQVLPQDRPLAQLFLTNQVLTRTSTSRSISPTSRPRHSLSFLSAHSSSPRLLGITPSAQRPPRLLRVHSSVSEVPGAVQAHAPAEAPPRQDSRDAIEKVPSPRLQFRTRPGVETSNQPLTSQASLAASSSSRPTVDPKASVPPTAPSITVLRHFPVNLISPRLKPTQLAGPGVPPPSPLTIRESRLTRTSMKPIPMGNMGIRERRSPFREGRRFIPLQDSDDEDEIECG